MAVGMTRSLAQLAAVATALLLALGCSASTEADDGALSDTDVSEMDTVAPVRSDTAPEVEPGYWYLSGAWTLTGGALEASPTVSLRYVPDDGDVCLQSATVTATARTPTEGHLAWDVTLDVPVDPCAWPGPVAWVVEWGASDPALNAAADRAALSVATSQGLYLSEGGTPLLVGLVGTSEQLAGEGAALTEAPYPDGLYLLRGLYGLRVSGE